MLSEQYPDIFWNNYEKCPQESSVSTYTLTKISAGGDVGIVSEDSDSGSVESVDREFCLHLCLDWLEGVSDDHWVLAGGPCPIAS